MKKRITILILVVLMVSITGAALLFYGGERSNWINYGDGLKADLPIRIDNDTDLQTQATNNHWSGDGTESNPYRIENYNINVSSARNGIYLGNTTLYVVIRNSEIYNVSGPASNSGDGAAIAIYNGRNITIENVYIHESKYFGIFVSSSSHIHIKSNRIENTTLTTSYGIYVEGSGNDVAVKDNFLYNSRINAEGIYFYYFDHPLIVNNTITGFRSAGIDLHYASHATLWNNTMHWDSVSIVGTAEKYYNHTIPLNNTVNDKPIYYYLDKDFGNTPISLPADVGELILANVSNAIVEDMNISYTSISYLIGVSHHIALRNISAYRTGSFSLNIPYSDNITVENSEITHSYSTGVYVYSVKDISLLNFNVNWCSSNGVALYYTYRIDIYNLTLSHNYYGLSTYNDQNYLNQYTHIENSRFEYMTQFSTKFTYTRNVVINNTKFVNGGTGVWLYNFCPNSVVTNNSFTGVAYGVYSNNADNLRIENNSIDGSRNSGIYLWYQGSTYIAFNRISSSSTNGIGLWFVNDSVVMNNTIENSGQYGIEIYGGTTKLGSNTVVGNVIKNSDSYGIYLRETTENLIYNNSLSYNNGTTDTYNPSHVQAYDDTSGNHWNTSGSPHGYGNYWADWTLPDNNGDGIVDDSYAIDGAAGAQDSYPRTTSPYIPEFQSLYIPLIFAGFFVFVSLQKRRKNQRSQ